MENSSKALLIAAVVLITIIIITIGIKVFTSASETGKIAMQTGDTISTKTQDATDFAISQIAGDTSAPNIGDYINLGTKILSGKPADWRILYKNENGLVYAILADYLPNTNAAVTAAGFTSESEKRGKYNVYSVTSRQDLLNRLENESAWNTLIPTALQNKGARVRGAPTAEILITSYNKKYGKSLSYTGSPNLYIDADSSKGVDTLYVPHSNPINGCYGYWLASPFAANASDVWRVYCRGFVDYGDHLDADYGVCPVVSLPSNIQVTKNGNIWTVVQ